MYKKYNNTHQSASPLPWHRPGAHTACWTAPEEKLIMTLIQDVFQKPYPLHLQRVIQYIFTLGIMAVPSPPVYITEL